MKAINLFLLSLLIFTLPTIAADKTDLKLQKKNFYKNVKPYIKNAATGQIIGLSETNHDGSTFFFEALTGSRFGHIGIVVMEKGKPMVYEANPPYSSKVTLTDFLMRTATTKGGIQATVAELADPLLKSEKKSLVASLKKMVKQEIPYDFAHDAIDSSAMDCSEFVHKAFLSIGRKVGNIEGLATLNTKSFDGFLMEYFEMMTGIQANDQMRFVSPASIIRDKKVRIVQSSLPIKVLSDLDILDGWKKAGGLVAMTLVFYAVDDDLEAMEFTEVLYKMLRPKAGKKPYMKSPKAWRCTKSIKKKK